MVSMLLFELGEKGFSSEGVAPSYPWAAMPIGSLGGDPGPYSPCKMHIFSIFFIYCFHGKNATDIKIRNKLFQKDQV